MPRPDTDTYYMGIACAVRERANCMGNKVGAILVLKNRIIATGYNGTPAGTKNCEDGGCTRCSQRHKFPSGKAYDVCICVHAEQNTILMSAKLGINTDGSTLYSTMKPCFGCAKELLQAGVRKVFFIHDWSYPESEPELRAQYDQIIAYFPEGVKKLDFADPRAEWAVSKRPQTPDTGHVAT